MYLVLLTQSRTALNPLPTLGSISRYYQVYILVEANQAEAHTESFCAHPASFRRRRMDRLARSNNYSSRTHRQTVRAGIRYHCWARLAVWTNLSLIDHYAATSSRHWSAQVRNNGRDAKIYGRSVRSVLQATKRYAASALLSSRRIRNHASRDMTCNNRAVWSIPGSRFLLVASSLIVRLQLTPLTLSAEEQILCFSCSVS